CICQYGGVWEDMMKETLTAQAWIEAAFRALTAGGPQAIRAEAIARDLKVSKGSFYWHFKDVPALKSEMLRVWKSQATDAIISAVEGEGGSPDEKLRRLVDLATGPANTPYGGALAEAAVRDWARYDPSVALVLKAVDERRLAYLVALFAESGATGAARRRNASILYGALIGLEGLSHQGLADLRGDLRYLLDRLLRAG
ncbi:unnamed protein product, partial [Laminaria digitata]